MTRIFWELNKNLNPLHCLVFPKAQDTHYETDELDESGQIDLELFSEIVKTSLPISDINKQTIVGLIKSGYTSGEIEE